MRLADPGGNGTVQVSFSAAHGFPLEAWWYRQGEDRPWRQLELKGAKKHDDGLWFVKEMRLEGPNWKTRVVFDHAEINQVGEPTRSEVRRGASVNVVGMADSEVQTHSRPLALMNYEL